ncbi:hypothetical protein FSP39_000842 [Pinctada imbricata]|uniref:Uncharacterized protein n=1 Tax=Pinctada imbricata TaxID=66713 RepID=A0AA88XH13_PINIB|nr:hypothetical protein FSP39_000842 [Pinctada imbricata]
MDSADDEEDDEFHIRISEFPSSFTLNDAIKSEKKASFECNKLEEELKDGYSTNEETIRTKNLVSYLVWRLENKDRAFTLCEENLAVDPSSIIALSNKGRYLRSLSRYHEADGVLKTLQLLRKREDFDCLLTSAEAEMAYSYSRFGPRFHDKCISIFERVINKSPEKNIWKFGLALTYRRETHFLNSPPKVKGACEENASKALMLLCEITASAECTENLKAKTWCEIGKILHGKDKNHQIFSRLPKNMASLTSEDCFLRALKICPDDIFVLQRCGQQFRYFKKLDKSIECLKRAQSIRETPFNLHQLALSLIKQVEVEHVKFRRSLTFDPNVVRPKSNANFEQTLTQNLSHEMAKLNISSPTYASSHVRTFAPDQLHNSSEKPVEYTRYSSLDDQNNQRQKHHQRYTKFRCGNDTHEPEKSQEFANQLYSDQEADEDDLIRHRLVMRSNVPGILAHLQK